MNLICWNVRGLGNPRAFRELRRLVADKRPTLLFLCETKMREKNCSWWKNKMGFSGCFMVDCIGKSGGLALLWNDSVNVSIKSYSPGHIDCMVQETVSVWRFTGFYGQPDVNLRRFSWDLIRKLKFIPELVDLPWLVGGDFNEIFLTVKNWEGFDLCGLQDIHSHGEFYTWVNRRSAGKAIFERLDRFVGCLQWRLFISNGTCDFLRFLSLRPQAHLYGNQI